MNAIEIKPGVYWVGGIDWNLRNFHGYLTQRGSTYNSYLVVDEKIVLVDTVRHYLFNEMLSRIETIVDPTKIDYIVSNHVEMDHSGSLPKIIKMVPKAKIITSPHGQKGLLNHFKENWNFQVVKTGESLSIGKRTLQFFLMPMVHWPDSMATYIPEEELLLPNDAFGQHIASAGRFDDEIGWDILREEAGKYYANIVLPYGEQVKEALSALGSLEIDMIGPSHGLIWRSFLPKILDEYKKWADNQTENKAVIVYDTMWNSTEKMAYKLQEGLEEKNIPVVMRNLKKNHISDVMTDLLTAKFVLIGSPTLNNGVLPTIGAFLTYIKGLKPKKRIGFAFGSYGWVGQSVKNIESVMKTLGWNVPVEGKSVQYIPNEDDLNQIKELGKKLAEKEVQK